GPLLVGKLMGRNARRAGAAEELDNGRVRRAEPRSQRRGALRRAGRACRRGGRLGPGERERGAEFPPHTASCNQPDDCAERAFHPRLPTLSIRTGQGLLLVAFVTHTYAVGTVPPSITYSVPVMVPARSEARKAIRLATSSGLDARPIGI